MEREGEIQKNTAIFPGTIEVRSLDDWRGVGDPKVRKTLQNRLNQRAYRRRQRKKSSAEQTRSVELQAARCVDLTNLRGHGYELCVLGPDSERSKSVLQGVENFVHMNFASGSPRSDLLLVITQLNIVRALHVNMDALGYRGPEMDDEALSAFSMIGPRCSHFRGDSALLPPSLQPTTIQRTIPHHPWLDLIPIPNMRDNLIRAVASLDDVQLCHDMCGIGSTRVVNGKRATGVLVWKDPWDPSGWEITEMFFRHWAWALQDCQELFHSTNTWRRRRGEKPLSFITTDQPYNNSVDI